MLLLVVCCHPGPVTMIERVSLLAGRKCLYLVGSLHPWHALERDTLRTLKTPKDLSVVKITPTQRTGPFAIDAIYNPWGEHCILGGVGRIIFQQRAPTSSHHSFTQNIP